MSKVASTVLLSIALASAQTVYLAGDSTMAKTGANDGSTAGWGAYFPNYVSLPVVNDAIGGRSARSFTREGRFDAIAEVVQSGDYVIIEFGHNDGGSLSTDNGRTDCNPVNGDYSTTCQTTYNGVAETVLTYEAYLVNAAKKFTNLGAKVLISSATPNNLWESGTFGYTPDRFSGYAVDAAAEAGVVYVNHQQAVADTYEALGYDAVSAFYPNDHTHTSPAGADAVTAAFVDALRDTDSELVGYLV